MKPIYKNMSVVPGAISPDKEMLWGYATVEVEDMDGDIVRVKGMDYSKFQSPPHRYIKLIAGHQQMLPDGTPPVVGRIEKFVESEAIVEGEKVPALMFGASYARDGKGEYTKLAKAYKDLYDSGYMDSFSVGFMAIKAKPRKGAGYDIEQSELLEISAVVVPSNYNANVKKALSDVGIELEDVPGWDVEAIVKRVSEVFAHEQGRLVDAMMKRLDERLDDFIGSYVVKAKSGAAPDDTKGTMLNERDIRKIASAIIGSLSK